MTSTRISCVVLTVVISVLSCSAQVADNAEAMRVWDRMIEAKGGRERLHGVTNLVVEQRRKSANKSVESQDLEFAKFFLLPGKIWFWANEVGIGVQQYDFEAEVGYETLDSSPVVEFRPKAVSPSDGRLSNIQFDNTRFNNWAKEMFFEGQMIYLMETKWFRPTIVSVTTVGREKHEQVVEARFGRETLDYHVDAKTYLVSKVVITTRLENSKSPSVDEFYLDKYVDVGGIKFPSVMSRDKDGDSRTSYKVNVDYNSNLFSKPPSSKDGPNAWRP